MRKDEACLKAQSFTLIELLVVIAIIGVISSITLVSLRGARERARIAGGYQFSQSINHALGAYAVGVWSFDRYGDPITDLSGYSNNCYFNGDPQEEPEGIIRKAIDLDGNDYLDCGNSPSSDTTDITVEAWFNPDIVTGGILNLPIPIVMKYEDGVNKDWGLGIVGEKIYFGYEKNSNDWDNNIGLLGTTILRTDQWYHAAFSYVNSSRVVTIYLNGVEENSTNLPAERPVTNKSVEIGRSCYKNDYFDGAIDEVRIYSGALTAGQIQKHYTEGLEKHKLAEK